MPWLEVFLAAKSHPGRPSFRLDFIRVVNTMPRQMATDSTRFLTISNSRTTVLQTLVAEKQPSLTSTHLWWLSDEHVAK